MILAVVWTMDWKAGDLATRQVTDDGSLGDGDDDGGGDGNGDGGGGEGGCLQDQSHCSLMLPWLGGGATSAQEELGKSRCAWEAESSVGPRLIPEP